MAKFNCKQCLIQKYQISQDNYIAKRMIMHFFYSFQYLLQSIFKRCFYSKGPKFIRSILCKTENMYENFLELNCFFLDSLQYLLHSCTPFTGCVLVIFLKYGALNSPGARCFWPQVDPLWLVFVTLSFKCRVSIYT